MGVVVPDASQFPIMTMNSVVHHPSMPSNPDSREFNAFQKLLRDIYRSSSISIQNIHRLQGHLHRIYFLQTTDRTSLILKCPPLRDMHLLRQECRSLETEARVLKIVKKHSHVPVPIRISYDLKQSNNIGAPFLLRSYIPGTSFADMLPYLSATEQSRIERKLGLYFNQLSRIESNSFGSISRVRVGTGHANWSEAFMSLLESALRDGEDTLVSLPYQTIRLHVTTHADLLDQIIEPKLVALNAGEYHNVIIDDRTNRIVGLLGFSNVVWGDPMLASVFSTATDAFWEGYGGKPLLNHGRHVRTLLYHMYRAVVGVVTQYHRPQNSSDEFEARRQLVWALNELNSVYIGVDFA